ncbi:MAG TPA: galactose oxidase early set domain-containing protein [Actinomycetes bacterium]
MAAKPGSSLLLARSGARARRAILALAFLGALAGLTVSSMGNTAQANVSSAPYQQSPNDEGDSSATAHVLVPTLRIDALSTDPAVSGSWQVLGYQMPVRGIHFAVMRTGNVLICAGSGNVKKNNEQHLTFCAEWNLTTGVMKKLPIPEDLFCSGHTELADGEILFNGGTKYLGYQGDNAGKWGGLASTYQFNPDDDTFTRYADMIGGRWYPTTIMQGNGKPLTIGGNLGNGANNPNTEVYDPTTHTWTRIGPSRTWPLYPNIKLLADGTFFYTGASTSNNTMSAGIWNPSTGTFTDVPGLTHTDHRNQAAAVMLPPAQLQQFVVMGGGSSNGSNAISDTNFVDLTQASPHYVSGPPLAAAKGFVSSVVLPDYTVLETGGSSRWRAGFVYEASILDPVTRTFSQVAPDPVGRTYHSSAFLLPDGRVVTLGSNPSDGSFDQRISIFSPPYLFKGPRPQITSAPAEIHYGDTISVASTDSGLPLVHMSLIRLPIQTHQNSPDERLVDIPSTFTDTSAVGTVTTNSNMAPPGYYYLTVVDADGVPSPAAIVHLS